MSTKCKPGKEDQERQSEGRPPKWMNVDHGIKDRDRSVPDMVKKQYERMQQDQKEQIQVSKQFLEDKSGGESTVYCKRALPKNENQVSSPFTLPDKQKSQKLKRIQVYSRSSTVRDDFKHQDENVMVHKLKNLDKTGERYFPLYLESDIEGFSFD